MKSKIKSLKNNLKYHVSRVDGVNSVTILVMIKVGSSYESSINNGISHFLEHVVFKGNKKYPLAIDISKAVDGIGGKQNAFTSKEYTGYYIKVSKQHIQFGLEFLSQLVFYPTFPKKDLEIEKKVVIEEINMYEDDPQSMIYRIFESLIFKNSSLGYQVLGKKENIKKFSREQLIEYHQYLYSPNRVVLSIAGFISPNIDLDALIKKYFLVQLPQTTIKYKLDTVIQKSSRHKFVYKNLQQCHIVIGYRTFGREHKDRYILSLLSAILGGGMSSRLFYQIREQKGLVYYIGAYPQLYSNNGYMAFSFGSSPELTQEVIDNIYKILKDLKDNEIENDELSKAKEYLKGNLLLGLEGTSDLANFYAEDILFKNKIRNVDDIIKKINDINTEDIQRLAKKIFINKNLNIAGIGPEKWLNLLNY